MSVGERAVLALWRGASPAARVARVVVAPLSVAYGLAVARRNARFDRGDGVVVPALPALSVGNLTVGGTGKTPVASWFVRALRARGARPALVLRGYGDDETRVHAHLEPDVPVIADPDRVRGIATAAERGADCVVLDDAFQHRRVARIADVVLLAADDWRGVARLLPAGPWREPFAALRRADAVLVTVKAAPEAQVAALVAAVRGVTPAMPTAVVAFSLGSVSALASLTRPGGSAGHPPAADGPVGDVPAAAWLAGRPVLAVSAIGDPAAFEAQLAAAGADVRPLRFRDHHAFDASDVAAIRAAAGARDVVCTLKDAVKLAAHWPRGVPGAWYVSQALSMRPDDGALAAVVDRLLAARAAFPAARPTSG